MLWGGPCYFVKNNEGGAKHQVGLRRSPASCQKLLPVWEDISAGMSGNTSKAESDLDSNLCSSSQVLNCSSAPRVENRAKLESQVQVENFLLSKLVEQGETEY